MNERKLAGSKAARTWLRGSIFVALAASLLVAAGKDAGRPRHTSTGPEAISLPVADVFSTAKAVAPGIADAIPEVRSSIPIRTEIPRGSSNSATPHATVSASSGVCARDVDCDDCNSCTNEACVGGFCVTVFLPADTVCSDGLFCNGIETCQGGSCVLGSAPNCGSQVCEEKKGACVDACVTDADCDDGRDCTNEHCGGGLCIQDVGPCGAGGLCQEPVSPATTPVCGNGRCCDGVGGCTRETFAACVAGGGRWLGAGSAVSTCSDDPCPAYSSGIAPEGAFFASLGPIGFAACNAQSDLGDDYTLNIAPGEFLRLRTIRWAGSVDRAGDVVRITWYDGSSNFIEDEFVTVGTAGIAVHTFDLPIPLIIPQTGFVTISPAAEFSPNARILLVTTDNTDVGSNDPSVLWSNGSPVAAQTAFPGSTGVLALEMVGEIGGEPVGACCNSGTGECTRTLSWLCGGFFQGVGTQCGACSNDPFAACDSNADCPACAGSGAPCNPNAECPDAICIAGSCDAGPNVGQSCDENVDCDPGDTCSSSATCVPIPPGCSVSACCANQAGIKFCEGGPIPGSACSVDGDCVGGTCTGITNGPGECVSVFGASCVGPGAGAGDPCFSDGDCDPANTCESDCPAGSTAVGFGTSCDPNCCPQSGTTGADECASIIFPRLLNVPILGAPPITVTFGGDNSSATGPDSCVALSPDPVWWEVLEFITPVEVRIDFCCSDPIKVPISNVLYSDCPCGEPIESSALASPFGGGGELSSAFGEPFCDGDNAWVTFGPLPPGTYFYPILSEPGNLGPYQMHITMKAPEEAACCLPSDFCVDLGTQVIMTDGGGFPISCAVTPCAVGSC